MKLVVHSVAQNIQHKFFFFQNWNDIKMEKLNFVHWNNIQLKTFINIFPQSFSANNLWLKTWTNEKDQIHVAIPNFSPNNFSMPTNPKQRSHRNDTGVTALWQKWFLWFLDFKSVFKGKTFYSIILIPFAWNRVLSSWLWYIFVLSGWQTMKREFMPAYQILSVRCFELFQYFMCFEIYF